MINVIPIEGIGVVNQGDDLAQLICDKLEKHFPLTNSDCLVVASKVVSKSRGRTEKLTSSNPLPALIERESKRILRRRDDSIMSETTTGFVCTNAGIDASNCSPGEVALLPKDANSAAHGIRKSIQAQSGFDVAVIICSKFDRPFRVGKTNLALGFSGIKAFVNLEGEKDFLDNALPSTKIAIPDELASAAELVMHKSSGNCAALIRGLPDSYRGNGHGDQLIRNQNEEFFS